MKKRTDMKKFLIIVILAIYSISLSAQSYVTPPELTFQDMRFVKGMSKAELSEKIYNWYKSKESEGFYFAYPKYIHLWYSDCPNFGASKFFGGEGTSIAFDFIVEPNDGYYVAKVVKMHSLSPTFDAFYGVNGELFPECYNKRQLKIAKLLLKYIFERSQLIFDEFAAYMGAE